jgi:hypothetical protein
MQAVTFVAGKPQGDIDSASFFSSLILVVQNLNQLSQAVATFWMSTSTEYPEHHSFHRKFIVGN